MNAMQRRRRAVVEKLVELALSRGIRSADLAPEVCRLLGDQKTSKFTDRINRAGMMAQIYYLLDIKGSILAEEWLLKRGSELDGFVVGYSSSPEEREAEIGRNNVDWDGCVF